MVDINANVKKYLYRRGDASARYASFDHCFNFFRAAWDSGSPMQLTDDETLQQSCLHLGFYLASWGMYRGSGYLWRHSSKALEPAVTLITGAPSTIWNADVDQYSESLVAELLDFGNQLRGCLPGKTSDTLVTKVMLGVFGCVPAVDQYFRRGFGTSGFNRKTLLRLRAFYEQHNELIDSHRIPTIDFYSCETQYVYSRAKVIDMAFFIEGNRPVSR